MSDVQMMPDTHEAYMDALIARLRPDPNTPKAVSDKPLPAGPGLRGWQLANQERQVNGQQPISYAEWAKTAAPNYQK